MSEDEDPLDDDDVAAHGLELVRCPLAFVCARPNPCRLISLYFFGLRPT